MKVVSNYRIITVEIFDGITNVEFGGNRKNCGEFKVFCFETSLGGGCNWSDH